MSRARASTSTAAARRRWPRLASSAPNSAALDHAPPRSRNPLSKDRAPSDRQIDGLHPPAARRRRPRRKDNSLARCFARSNSPLHRFSRKRRTRAPATPLHAKEVDCRPALRVNFRPALTRSASGSNKAMHSFTRQSYARLLLALICNRRGRSRDSVRHAGSSRTMAGKHSPTADPIARNLGQTERRELFAVLSRRRIAPRGGDGRWTTVRRSPAANAAVVRSRSPIRRSGLEQAAGCLHPVQATAERSRTRSPGWAIATTGRLASRP